MTTFLALYLSGAAVWAMVTGVLAAFAYADPNLASPRRLARLFLSTAVWPIPAVWLLSLALRSIWRMAFPSDERRTP